MAETSPEPLRQIIVRAAMPLLGEFNTLTTAQLARAAGIEEADLLAVFPDKDAVVQACAETIAAQLGAAMDPAAEIRLVHAIRLDQPLASRLIEVLGIVDAYHSRVRADLDAFRQSMVTGADAAAAPGTPSSGRKDLRFLSGLPEFRQAVARLLEPDGQSLRLPVEALAEAFLTMTHAGPRTANEDRSPLPGEQVVDLFLHGALSGP